MERNSVTSSRTSGFRVPRHEDMIERMQLQVMFPLECGTENKATRQQSAFNEHHAYPKALSSITRRMDAQTSADVPHLKQRPMPVIKYDYEPTPVHPVFVPQVNPPPDPGSYYPDYRITKPSAPVISMENKEEIAEPRKREVYSTGEILKLYNTKLRDFDVEKLSFPPQQDLHIQEVHTKIPPRSMSTMSSAPRDTLFRNRTAGDHLAPYDVKYEFRVPMFVDMNGQKHREVFPVGSDKDIAYQHVAEQLDKTKPRTKVFCDMKREASRNRATTKNKRVEMLDRLKKEQMEFMAELKPKVKTRTVKRRPKSSFACQTPRKAVFCDSRVDELPEEVFPYDPMKSFFKTQPRVRAIAIKDRRDPSNPLDFWRVPGPR